MSDRCVFCERDAMTGNVVSPKMCALHLDLALLASRVARTGAAVSGRSLEMAYRALDVTTQNRIGFKAAQINGLLMQVRCSGYPTPEHWHLRVTKQEKARKG